MPKVKLTESPFVKYIVEDAPGFEKFNEKFLPVIIEALNSIHINMTVTENELSLFIPASYYNEYHKRKWLYEANSWIRQSRKGLF